MSIHRRAEVARMSETAVDILLGAPQPELEAGELAGITRRTESAIGAIRMVDMTRAELLAEVDRTMAAIEAYPVTPDLPDADLSLPMPEWSSL